MNIERLTRLRNFLRDNVKDERFNLATWAGNDKIEWGGLRDLSCGTTACAMGWATTIPEFQALGLKLVRQPDTISGEFYPPTIEFEGETHFHAAARFCGISDSEAEYLFNPSSYGDEDQTTKDEVVERITDFIDNGPPDYLNDAFSDEDDEDGSDEY